MKNILFLFLFLFGCSGNLPENFQSWYVAGHRTVNVNFGQPPNEAVVTEGELSYDIIVLSDIGSSIDYIKKDGSTRWRKSEGEAKIRGLHRWDDNNISYVNEYLVNVIDIETGHKTRAFNPVGQKMIDFQKTDSGYIATTETSVILLDESFKVVWRNPYKSKYSRSAIKVDNIVIVADTFGHRVYGVDILTGDMVFVIDEYFPNMVAEHNGNVLVVGEHSNRVYILEPETGRREPVFSCGLYPYNDIYSTTELIQSMEQDTDHPLLIDPTDPNWSKSICSEDLYSPNGADCLDGTCYIASTDDGTVIEVQYGVILAKVSGFNNPANVVIIQE